ncbi:hypothetical protein ACFVAD_09325 [Sutcliffiella sp. NPDC057660]|uniref:hypothetical protein n=1 Tax=Sutcliffiella sp. NPDC057660 TaxID=3346199 RepID=UPI003682C49C
MLELREKAHHHVDEELFNAGTEGKRLFITSMKSFLMLELRENALHKNDEELFHAGSQVKNLSSHR